MGGGGVHPSIFKCAVYARTSLFCVLTILLHRQSWWREGRMPIYGHTVRGHVISGYGRSCMGWGGGMWGMGGGYATGCGVL